MYAPRSDPTTSGGPAARIGRLQLREPQPQRRLARALHGRNRVARTLLASARQGFGGDGVELREVEVNGQRGGLLLDAAGKVIGVVALDIAAGQIQAVSSVVNPDKLAHVAPVGDLRALLAGPRAPGPGGDRPL